MDVTKDSSQYWKKGKIKVSTIEIYVGSGGCVCVCLKIQYMSHSQLAQGATGHMSLRRQLPLAIWGLQRRKERKGGGGHLRLTEWSSLTKIPKAFNLMNLGTDDWSPLSHPCRGKPGDNCHLAFLHMRLLPRSCCTQHQQHLTSSSPT